MVWKFERNKATEQRIYLSPLLHVDVWKQKTDHLPAGIEHGWKGKDDKYVITPNNTEQSQPSEWEGVHLLSGDNHIEKWTEREGAR